ncbi:MAG: 4Fe-4S ferredoxin [Bacteroidetes bacterium GWF2_49_14]|nr:MAG: 4Fe-4S ferredoxin [Bacteroidetes bacterium GWF2_49_14]HBB90767.1 4Fe-4S ferredoxin [Bacteroidales bacterium]
MEVLLENILIYAGVFLLIIIIVFLYLRKQKVESRQVDEKIRIAKEEGLHEPVSLHPVVDVNKCIRTGACISACPEKDILGISNGKATIINASRCVGHGACFHACPVEAITLYIGTEKRGVELPHVSQNFETNVSGIFIAGEIGGMGLIKNAVEQGKQAVENLARTIQKNIPADYDLVVIGAGPAGISATLTARKLGLKVLTLEQDTLGGTVFTFPRSKIVMTSAMDLPLHGKVKLFETSKAELLDLWVNVLNKNKITITENSKVDSIVAGDGRFVLGTTAGDHYSTRRVLLAIGRRGSPRKLNVPGEELDKVAYRLLEPELLSGKRIVVVGGGDSAVESALLLMDENRVTLMYRGEVFGRLKPKNSEKIKEAAQSGKIDVRFKTSLTTIDREFVTYHSDDLEGPIELKNDLVFIFAGGELPTQFLEKSGILITRKFGEAILKH